MTERYYISDTHFSHANIIKYGNRPFNNVLEMDEQLIQNWNEIVRPQDSISHLGDVTMLRGNRQNQEKFIRLIGRLNGHKRIYLGNHDHFPAEVYLEAGFEKIYATWRTDERIIFSHIPLHPNSLNAVRANCHGHTHQAPDYAPARLEWKGQTKVVPYINLSVERTEYKPVHLDEILARVNNL